MSTNDLTLGDRLEFIERAVLEWPGALGSQPVQSHGLNAETKSAGAS